MKTAINQFWYRLKVSCKILFNPKLRWIFIPVSEENFLNILKEKDDEVEITFSYHRMQEYNFWRIIKGAADCKDDEDMILDKAIFNAKAEEHIRNRKN